MKLVFSILVLKLLAVISSPINDGIVEIENGKIRGELRDYYYAFEGIPYAEPPINENRFAAPKPYKNRWEDVREFKKFGPSCIQWDHFQKFPNLLIGEEDCLTINVYVPKDILGNKKMNPVLFFIHGGAFMFGSSELYDDRHFMKKNVILVTFNYRLGPMGFLSTEDEVIPGNMGLKDQVMALKWVHKNIKKFSGDSSLITIMGASAGGASVHLFYMSDLTKGLFKNGISFSGCALNPWIITENAKQKSHKLASILNCPTDNHFEMLSCLRKISATDIVKSVQHFLPFLYNPITPFGPVIEKKSNEAFITEYPSVLLKSQKIQKLPWLVSATQDEGLYPAAEFYSKDHLKTIYEKWDTLAPHILDFNGTISSEAEKQEVSEKIKQFYVGDHKPFDDDDKINDNLFFGIRNMLTDRLFKYGIGKSVLLHSKISPTYSYVFDYKIQTGFAELFSEQNKVNLGISHGEDVLLIFYTDFQTYLPLNNEEQQLSSNLIDIFIEFSNEGRLHFNGIELERIENDQSKYLVIKAHDRTEFKNLVNFGNSSFWDEVLNFEKEN